MCRALGGAYEGCTGDGATVLTFHGEKRRKEAAGDAGSRGFLKAVFAIVIADSSLSLEAD